MSDDLYNCFFGNDDQNKAQNTGDTSSKPLNENEKAETAEQPVVPPYQPQPQEQPNVPPYQPQPQEQPNVPPYQPQPQEQPNVPPYQPQPQEQPNVPPYQPQPQEQPNVPPYHQNYYGQTPYNIPPQQQNPQVVPPYKRENEPYRSQNGYTTSYYGSNGASGMYSYPGPMQTQKREEKPMFDRPQEEYKKEKTKKNHSSLSIVICAVLALVCGFAGAFGGYYIMSAYGKLPASTSASTVIYQSVDTGEKTAEEAGNIAVVAEKALPSVVEVMTESVSNNIFYGQYITEGAGSGVIISEDGYIVTNNHVVAGTTRVNVRLYSGEEFKARVCGTDVQTDLAVIKIDDEVKLTPAVLGFSTTLTVGEVAVAIGNPLGKLGGTVTDGIISALDREITVEGETMRLLQTNASINPGNSGGGLFNSKAELVGIVNAKTTGDDIEGLGYAIPVDTAKPVIEELIKNGYVSGRPALGITVVEISNETQRYQYNVSEYGVYIKSFTNGDFQVGDRLIAIDGNTVSTFNDIRSIISGHKVGDTITVTVSRSIKSGRTTTYKIVDVTVTLQEETQAKNNT